MIDDDVYNADKTFYIRLLYPEGGELNRYSIGIQLVLNQCPTGTQPTEA